MPIKKAKKAKSKVKKPEKKKTAKKPKQKKPGQKKANLKKPEGKKTKSHRKKEPIPPLPAPETLIGKSHEELNIFWENILKSERALDRKAPDFQKRYREHYPLLRIINEERRKLQNP